MRAVRLARCRFGRSGSRSRPYLLTAAPAQAAGLTATPNPVDFGQVPAGSTKTLDVVVTNTDAASANVKITISAGTQFVLQGSPVNCVLGQNDACTVHVRYTASDQPADNGTLHAQDQIQLARKVDAPLTGRSGPPDCPPTGPAPEECGHERFITVADPLNETQQTATANWNFTIATDWDDIGCVDPPEGSPNPGAFVSIAPSVLDMDQTGLGSFLQHVRGRLHSRRRAEELQARPGRQNDHAREPKRRQPDPPHRRGQDAHERGATSGPATASTTAGA